MAEPEITTPDWVKDAVFYQIFPDRFARSPSLDAEKPGHLEPWDADPTPYGYKGGDLLGVAEKLDYLQDLGITALYFNPIFQSASNHRYHTHDYYRVDPLLGGDAAFEAMLAECKRRGLRVVLDGVFNHASRGFFQFNDVLENGASSPWLDWWTIREHPANAYDHGRPPGYAAWVGLHALPEFNTDNPQVREYLMRVGEYWLRNGIDGWRLDVPFEIATPGFWEEFRRRTKAIDPEAYLVGEVWGESQEWLGGGRFDGVMNYVFTEAAIAFAAGDRVRRALVEDRSYAPWPGIDGTAYAAKIDHLLGLYPWPVQQTQLNLLDSHDTARLLTIAGGDAASVRLAALLMFTFPGAPCVYYGDEIGLPGALPDHWTRRTFPWDHPERWDRDLHAAYKAMIALRRAEPALRRGAYHRLHADRDTYAFARSLDGDAVVVAVNVATEPRTVEARLADLGQTVGSGEPSLLHASGGEATVSVTEHGLRLALPARGGAVVALGRGAAR